MARRVEIMIVSIFVPNENPRLECEDALALRTESAGLAKFVMAFCKRGMHTLTSL
jgi:hypothetical protein